MWAPPARGHRSVFVRTSPPRSFSTKTEKAAAEPQASAIPGVSADMVIKAKDSAQNIVLKVQDTGGQPIFLSILELLTTTAATVYLVVISLSDLENDFETAVEEVARVARAAPAVVARVREWPAWTPRPLWWRRWWWRLRTRSSPSPRLRWSPPPGRRPLPPQPPGRRG